MGQKGGRSLRGCMSHLPRCRTTGDRVPIACCWGSWGALLRPGLGWSGPAPQASRPPWISRVAGCGLVAAEAGEGRGSRWGSLEVRAQSRPTGTPGHRSLNKQVKRSSSKSRGQQLMNLTPEEAMAGAGC